MVRLPTLNDDWGEWGSLLNTFLSVAHKTDGALKAFYNVTDFGAIGDDVTDSSTAIANALSAINAVGGGMVLFPAGTYITGNQTLYNKVHLLGAGIGATVIKLKNNANTDLFSASTSSINVSASYGTGSTGGAYNWSIQNMTLDGNRSNQSSGTSYPVRVYGYGHILHNVRILNGYSGGILSDWNGGNVAPLGDSMEAQWLNVKIHDSNGIGLQLAGPHDSQFVNVEIYNTTSHGFHLAPNCAGSQFVNCHAYGPAQSVTALPWLIEASDIQCINSEAEGSDTSQVVVLANGLTWLGGHVFGANPYNVTGFKIGQTAGGTPIPGQVSQSGGVTTAKAPSLIRIDTRITRCEGSNGAFWFANDGGYNVIRGTITNTAGSAISSTAPLATTNLDIKVQGQSADGSRGRGGVLQVATTANSGVTITDGSNDVLNINTSNKRIEVVNGAELRLWKDIYGNIACQINSDGTGNAILNGAIQIGGASTIFSGSGAPSSNTGNNGDYYFRSDTPGSANQRIYVKSSGSWVGIV